MSYHEKHPYHTQSFVDYLLLPKTMNPELYASISDDVFIIKAVQRLDLSKLWNIAYEVTTGEKELLFKEHEMYVSQFHNNLGKETLAKYLQKQNSTLMKATEKYILYRKAAVSIFSSVSDITFNNTPNYCSLFEYVQEFTTQCNNVHTYITTQDTTVVPSYLLPDLYDEDHRHILQNGFQSEISNIFSTINSSIIQNLIEIYNNKELQEKILIPHGHNTILEYLASKNGTFTRYLKEPFQNYPGSCQGINNYQKLSKQIVEKVVPYWKAGGTEDIYLLEKKVLKQT